MAESTELSWDIRLVGLSVASWAVQRETKRVGHWAILLVASLEHATAAQ